MPPTCVGCVLQRPPWEMAAWAFPHTHTHTHAHSLRRSGASELSRLGVPLPDLLLYGRWLSERSAREYIRRGEVAVLRIRNGEDGPVPTRARLWCSRWASVFELADVMVFMGVVKVRPGKLTPEFVATLEILVLSK